jgi:hypothetical protein
MAGIIEGIEGAEEAFETGKKVLSAMSAIKDLFSGHESNSVTVVGDKRVELVHYCAGAAIANHTPYDFQLVEKTGGIWSGDSLDKPAHATWLQAPADSLDAGAVLACGLQDQYVDAGAVELEVSLAFYSRTSPVPGLGIAVFLWLEVHRDGNKDATVDYRAGAFAMFTETVDQLELADPKRDLSRMFRQKRTLLKDSKMNFEPPISNTFAYSEGTNIKARGFYGCSLINPLKPGEQNYRCTVAVTAGQISSFQIHVEPYDGVIGVG